MLIIRIRWDIYTKTLCPLQYIWLSDMQYSHCRIRIDQCWDESNRETAHEWLNLIVFSTIELIFIWSDDFNKTWKRIEGTINRIIPLITKLNYGSKIKKKGFFLFITLQKSAFSILKISIYRSRENWFASLGENIVSRDIWYYVLFVVLYTYGTWRDITLVHYTHTSVCTNDNSTMESECDCGFFVLCMMKSNV